MTTITQTDADAVWEERLAILLHIHSRAQPRGRPTHELIGPPPLVLSMKQPLVTNAARKLSYTFAAAEALWVIDGRTDVESLAKHNPRMREFSDDGVTLAGAYGPPIHEQFDYVVEALVRDEATRQAALSIWKPCPKPSRDIPCTLALVFQLRSLMVNNPERLGLHAHVMMRSSDIWLGVPYDVFTFSMIAAKVLCHVNARRIAAGLKPAELGDLHLYAASSHLYVSDELAAIAALEAPSHRPCEAVPADPIARGDWGAIRGALERCRDAVAWNDPVWNVRPYKLEEVSHA